MASIIDGYCSLINKSTESIWIKSTNSLTENLKNPPNYYKRFSNDHEKMSNSNSQEFNKSITSRLNILKLILIFYKTL